MQLAASSTTPKSGHASGGTVRYGRWRSAALSRVCQIAKGWLTPFAVHWAVGGRHDGPVPGDLLCAALASCAESTLRIVASHHRLRLDAVRCIATGDVDVRGTLGVSRGVDIGFQQMQLQIELTAPRASASERRRLLRAVENSCVVLQTLRNGVSVRLESPDLATDPS